MADLSLTPIILDIGVTDVVTLTEVALDPFIDPHTAAHHVTEAQAHTATTKTCHTTDPCHAGVSPEMTVDPRTYTSSKHHYKTPKRPSSSSHQMPWKSKGQEVQTSHN